MAQKQKTQKVSKLSGDAAKLSRQKKTIQQLKKKENWMKWALVTALIVILLLLLFIGYATDWTAGLRKDAATTPIGAGLNSSRTGAGSEITPSTGDGSTGGGATSGGAGTTGGSDTITDRTGASSDASTATNNSTSTTNNSTTTNNNTTTQDDVLRQLYDQTNAGDSIDEVISQAQSLGISVDCTETLLVKECTFTAGGQSFETKSVSGAITSVLGL